MLNIKIICIGKIKEKWILLGCDEYLKRLKLFCKIDIIQLPEYKITNEDNTSFVNSALEYESNFIMSKISNKSYIFSMCIEGESLTSIELAKKINDITLDGTNDIVFIIGSSFGLSNSIKQKSNFKLSLSVMTFTHQMVCYDIYTSNV